MAAGRAIKFGQHLKELRIHLCQKSVASQGVRDFIEKNYVAMKQINPKSPILIRECSGAHPVVYARYEYGQESSQSLANKSDAQVATTIESMATASR